MATIHGYYPTLQVRLIGQSRDSFGTTKKPPYLAAWLTFRVDRCRIVGKQEEHFTAGVFPSGLTTSEGVSRMSDYELLSIMIGFMGLLFMAYQIGLNR